MSSSVRALPVLLIGPSFVRSGRSGVGDATDRLRTTCRPQKAFCLRVDSFDGRRNDANVASELEDQVVHIRGSQGAQGR